MIDPGVLVSALISPDGAPAALLDLVMAGQLVLVVSPALLDELVDVLARDRFRRYVTVDEFAGFVAGLHGRAVLADDPPQAAPVCRDPTTTISWRSPARRVWQCRYPVTAI